MAQQNNDTYVPQNSKYAEKPGEYSLVLRVVKPEINPGDIIHLQVYITGYGEIHGPKFMFSPPPEFINMEESKVLDSLSFPKKNKDFKTVLNTAKFGHKECQMDTDGCISQLSGAKYEASSKWKEPTIFYDYPWGDDYGHSTPTIASEKKLGDKAPIEIYLKTKRETPSGTHNLQCYLTYCDGQRWKMDRQSVNVVVPNWFRRNEKVTWGVAITGVTLTLGSLSLNILRFFGLGVS